jgi:hypothetical protein
MGFLRPKAPPLPPIAPPPPSPPPATAEDLSPEQLSDIEKAIKLKKKGYTETVLTGMTGDESEPEISVKTLLGE